MKRVARQQISDFGLRIVADSLSERSQFSRARDSRRLSGSRRAAARAGLAERSARVRHGRDDRPRRAASATASSSSRSTSAESTIEPQSAIRNPRSPDPIASLVDREWLTPTASTEVVHRFDAASGKVRAASRRSLRRAGAGGASGAGRSGNRGAACWPTPGSRADRATRTRACCGGSASPVTTSTSMRWSGRPPTGPATLNDVRIAARARAGRRPRHRSGRARVAHRAERPARARSSTTRTAASRRR